VEVYILDLWQIIAALIQGLVEWLPISSEGQTVQFLYAFSNIPTSSLLTVVVWLHLGTALAVVVRYPRTILDIISYKDEELFKHLLVATLFTAITAIPLYVGIKLFLQDSFNAEAINILVGALLIVTALVLYLPTRQNPDMEVKTDTSPTTKIAALTGLVQGFSVLPGISRSGVTVSALLMQKVDKETALRFSFLMSVPAVLGILAIEVLTGDAATIAISITDLAIMEIIVFITGLASMGALLKLAQKINFWKLCLVFGSIAILFGIPALI
jgi:undecaprenyl-diphosphatase